METPPTQPILVLVRDLMFAGRISAMARAEGVEVKMMRDPAKLVVEGGGRLIVDLNLDGAIDAASAWRGRTGGNVVGFVSHVDADAIGRARAAGIDQVLPRSLFVQKLGEILK